MSMMIQCQATDQPDAGTVEIDVRAGERADKQNAYALKPIGTLEMTREEWTVFADALAKGIRRPNVVTFI